MKTSEPFNLFKTEIFDPSLELLLPAPFLAQPQRLLSIRQRFGMPPDPKMLIMADFLHVGCEDVGKKIPVSDIVVIPFLRVFLQACTHLFRLIRENVIGS